MRLSFVSVQDWGQALDLLRVRNACREGMTHDTGTITMEQQAQFFLKLQKGDEYEAYLLVDHERHVYTAVGYGLLKWDGEKYWMTAGLTPSMRGRGLSRLIINFITEMGHREGRDVWIDVYDDNLALFGDIRTGYEFVTSTDLSNGRVIHVMRHRRERKLGPREGEWLSKHGHPQEPKEATPLPEVDQLTEMLEVDAISREPFPPPSYEIGPSDERFIIKMERGWELPQWPSGSRGKTT